MTTPMISALGTDVAVSLVGTGSFVPETRVSNRQILDRIRPARPDGRLLEPEWIERHVGIVERRLDFDFDTRTKRSRADGGLYDGDLALRAARAALADARTDADDVDVFVHITTTPDTIACQDHLRYLTAELGLRRDADLVHHNLGCAGLSAAWRTAASSLVAQTPATALVVASNCPSGYFAAEANPQYRQHPSGKGWLVPLIFADGTGAVVFRSGPQDEHAPRRAVRGAVRDQPRCRAGELSGGRVPSPHLPSQCRRTPLPDGRQARARRVRAADDAQHAAPRRGLADAHQANGRVRLRYPARCALVSAPGERCSRTRGERALLGLSSERVPLNVDRYGNTSAASTLLLLDEDRRAGRVHDGDLVVFMWIGAGNGAMNGYAALVL